MRLDLAGIGGSALTDTSIAVPEQPTAGIPVTYVPARNTILLALALGWAEVLGAEDIFVGVNAVDYSGYPDCRPAFIDAFSHLATLATKAGVEGHPCRVQAPLISWSKQRIIREGMQPRRRLFPDRLLLSGGRSRRRLRPLRLLPAASRRLRGGRRAGSDDLPGAPASVEQLGERCVGRLDGAAHLGRG